METVEGSPKKLKYPKSVGFIVVNEFCERFSYYGMRAVLSLYLRSKLQFDDNGATVVYHVFTMFAYFFPLIGAMIADGFLGRFKTIFYLSMIYATGSILLSVTAVPTLSLPALELTILSLILIAFGTGGIKPCVSAFGGDQFKLPEQEKYLSYFFSLFYFSINAGSLLSMFLTPIFRANVHCFGDNDCYPLAFGVPGVLMIVAIVFFVAGKRLYIIRKPSGNIIGTVSMCVGHAVTKSIKSKEKREHWLDHADDKYDAGLIEDIKSTLSVLVLFIPLPVFWALFDQQGSRWTFQADRMRQDVGSWSINADQMQVVNPLLILVFIPVFEMAIYPFMTKCKLIKKPLHKMIWGGIFAALAFIISGIVELNLLPTYGVQLSDGLAQMRVYNGYNCSFTLNLHTPDSNTTSNYEIDALSAYQATDIFADGYVDVPYFARGQSGECATVSQSGVFHLKEKTANSFFIQKQGITEFTDKIDKAIDGTNVRVLANVNEIVPINILSTKRNRTLLTLPSSDTTQHLISQGSANVMVNGKIVLSDYDFKAGAVYTILYEDTSNSANVVQITPENSVHVLWLLPQYVVMTMGEVMFSVTGLEFSFTQSPTSMKSVLQAIWLLTVAFGNLIVVLIVEGNFLDAQWKEFFLFAGLMLIDMLIFTVMAFRYKYVDPKSSTENIVLSDKTKDQSKQI